MGVIDLVIDPKWEPDEEYIWNSLLSEYEHRPIENIAWGLYLHCQAHPHRVLPMKVAIKIHGATIKRAKKKYEDYRKTNPLANQDWMAEKMWVSDVDYRVKELGQSVPEALEWWLPLLEKYGYISPQDENESIDPETLRQRYYRSKYRKK